MSSQLIFGRKIWSDFILYGCSLLSEQESLLPNNQQQIFHQMFPNANLIPMNSNGYSSQSLLRIAFGRIYYGCLQIFVDKFHVKRFVRDSSIHTRVKTILKAQADPNLYNYFNKLYYLRIWADYRPAAFEIHFNTNFSQALEKQMRMIAKLLQLL
jgi:hypothetical protein